MKAFVRLFAVYLGSVVTECNRVWSEERLLFSDVNFSLVCWLNGFRGLWVLVDSERFRSSRINNGLWPSQPGEWLWWRASLPFPCLLLSLFLAQGSHCCSSAFPRTPINMLMTAWERVCQRGCGRDRKGLGMPYRAVRKNSLVEACRPVKSPLCLGWIAGRMEGSCP